MLFEVKSIYEEADFAAFLRAKGRKDRLGYVNQIITKASYCVTGVILVPALLYGMYRMMIWNGNYFLSLAGGLLCCFMLVAAVNIILVGTARASRLLWRNYADRVEEFTLTFTEDGYTDVNSVSQSRLDYSVVNGILEDASRYYLLLCNGKAMFIRKDRFTHGDPEQFRDFIQQKTGKPVEYVK